LPKSSVTVYGSPEVSLNRTARKAVCFLMDRSCGHNKCGMEGWNVWDPLGCLFFSRKMSRSAIKMPKFGMQNDIIVLLLNIRLNISGFLLEWVKT